MESAPSAFVFVFALTTTMLASAQTTQFSPPVAAPVLQSGSVPTDAENTGADAETPQQQPLSSTEEGQTPMDESFANVDDAQLMRETRRKAFADTKINMQLRSYYFDRDKFDDSSSEAWALGGSLGLKTGYFRERFALGATGYTSQKLQGDEDKDGTALLKPGQKSFTVLGELYGEALLWPGARFTAGRRLLETPYINADDTRMSPNTFEYAAVQALTGGKDGQPEWRYGFGYVDEIKQRNADEFISMSTAAGSPADVKRGVYAAGWNFRQGAFSLGAIDYYSNDIINIFYAETKYAIPLTDKLRLQLAAQYTDQQSAGDDLLTGSSFSGDQWGVKGEVAYGGALFSTGYTSTGNGAGMRNPWSGYPGYTDAQVGSFNRAGEDAWMLRAAYAFESVPGLSAYCLRINGSDPTDPALYKESETDLNLQWNAPGGPFEGLMLRVRYAMVDQDAPGNPELTDFRFMIYYDPPRF